MEQPPPPEIKSAERELVGVSDAALIPDQHRKNSDCKEKTQIKNPPNKKRVRNESDEAKDILRSIHPQEKDDRK